MFWNLVIMKKTLLGNYLILYSHLKEYSYQFIKCSKSLACCCLVTSVMSNSCVTPWTVARQAPLSMGFSRQEYWSGLPCSPPGDLPNPGIEPWSPALQADSLSLSHQGSPSPLHRKLPVVKRCRCASHSCQVWVKLQLAFVFYCWWSFSPTISTSSPSSSQ